MSASQRAEASLPPLKPYHLLLSDEPLLLMEDGDRIRQQAKAQGFSDRLVFEQDSSWNTRRFSMAWQSNSLFASRKLLEIRCQRTADAAVLEAVNLCFSHPHPDCMLLMLHPWMKKKDRNQSWVQQFAQHGQLLLHPTPEGPAYRNWLTTRLKKQQLQASGLVIDWLAQATAGNLLAAAQALDVLTLLYGKTPLSLDNVQAALSNVSQHDAYSLLETILCGDLDRSVTILEQLRFSGEPVLLILHALTRELRYLAQANAALSSGLTPAQALAKAGVWTSQIARLTPVLLRLRERPVHQLLQLALELDRSIKGRSPEAAENLLLRLVAAMAGKPLLRHSLPQN